MIYHVLNLGSIESTKKARIRTRSKLLCAARTVFGCKGIESTAINDITEAAGVSFGS
ncbi:TetR family transcriptional regulator [Pseudomonas capeferrum]|nr:TetR family transcriptional regulator [Pseudomonas capeferrum]